MENFLYIFEFVVDDLLVTRPNCCAPEDYPTCVTISFRKNVFVHIYDREWGKCVDLCKPKCCKCVLFPLDSPVTNEDLIFFHVYKKRDDQCKFLIGATDMPAKPIFDKVTKSYDEANPDWEEVLQRFLDTLPDPRDPANKLNANCNECDHCDIKSRPEQFCPANKLTKHILPIFNMRKIQTGNLTILIRLVCNGPNIVSCYHFGRMCNAGCPPVPCPPENCDDKCGGSPKEICDSQDEADECDEHCRLNNGRSPVGPYCIQTDPCCKPVKRNVCKRYFACNLDKGCPCSECEDECDRECPSGCAKKREEEKQRKLAEAALAACPPPQCPRKKRKSCKTKCQ